jgi:hypothetical protein
MFDNPYEAITVSQRQFVHQRGAAFDGRRWTVDYRDNLFAPLHAMTAREFEKAGELTEHGGGRIAAPHSSTALAINMFDVWRGVALDPLGEAMQLDVQRVVGYERAHEFDFPKPAQPDIEFADSDGMPIAVEIKLREPYDRRYTNSFADRYFETPGLWEGLPALHELARHIWDGSVTFTTLHSAQLIKHAIGLTHSYESDFALGYLWHYIPSDTGRNHIRELAEFTAVASADIAFGSITVAELLERIDPERTDSAWLDYMTNRYVTSMGL